MTPEERLAMKKHLRYAHDLRNLDDLTPEALIAAHDEDHKDLGPLLGHAPEDLS